MRDDALSTNAVTMRLFVYYFAALQNTLGVQQYMIPAPESFKYDITKDKGQRNTGKPVQTEQRRLFKYSQF